MLRVLRRSVLQVWGTRPVALIREARNFVCKSKWPVRSLPLLQLNTGTMKFTSYEAQAIEPLVSNSPFLAWMYQILSVRAFSNSLGVLEIGIGILIAARPISATASAIGSLLAVAMFFTTLSFVITTSPTWEASTGGFPHKDSFC